MVAAGNFNLGKTFEIVSRKERPPDDPAVMERFATQDFRLKWDPSSGGKLFHQRRQLEDGQLVFLANSSLEQRAVGSLKLKGASITRLDLSTGATLPYPARRDGTSIEMSFDLPPAGSLLLVTGGPMVVKAAMQTGKRAICAGPGNPPVFVDDTCCPTRAAKAIISGAAFDNNLLCIGEKQVFVLEQVADKLMQKMSENGAVKLTPAQLDRLTQAA